MQTKHIFVGTASELGVRFYTGKTSLSSLHPSPSPIPVVFLRTVPVWFLCCSSSLRVCGFKCGICVVLICSSLLPLVPREGRVS